MREHDPCKTSIVYANFCGHVSIIRIILGMSSHCRRRTTNLLRSDQTEHARGDAGRMLSCNTPRRAG
jgi:hypothetical protein